MKEYSRDRSGPSSSHDSSPSAEPSAKANSSARKTRRAKTAEETESGRCLEALLVQRIRRSTALDVGGIRSSVDPKLAEQGKAGVATGPREVSVAPERADDEQLLLHEVAHAVQLTPVAERKQGEAKPSKDAGAPDGGPSAGEADAKGVDLEAEADAFANAVQTGQPFSIRGTGSGPLYQDDLESGESKTEPITEILSTSGERTKVKLPLGARMGEGSNVIKIEVAGEAIELAAVKIVGKNYDLVWLPTRIADGDLESVLVSFCKGEGECASDPNTQSAEESQSNVEENSAVGEEADVDEEVTGSGFRDILKNTDKAMTTNIRALLSDQKQSREFLPAWDRLVRAHEHFKGIHLEKHEGDNAWNMSSWRDIIHKPVLDETISKPEKIPGVVKNTSKASLDLELGDRPASASPDKNEPVKSLLVKSIKDDVDYPDPAPGVEVEDLDSPSENELVVRYALKPAASTQRPLGGSCPEQRTGSLADNRGSRAS